MEKAIHPLNNPHGLEWFKAGGLGVLIQEYYSAVSPSFGFALLFWTGSELILCTR